jgi:hypothetical protein
VACIGGGCSMLGPAGGFSIAAGDPWPAIGVPIAGGVCICISIDEGI